MRWAAGAGLGLALLAVCWALLLNVHSGLQDTAIYMAVRDDDPAAVRLAKLVTRLGSRETLQVAVLAAAMFLAWQGRLLLAASLLLLTTLGDQAEHFVKSSLGLPRPPSMFRLAQVDSPTFPSGHAADSMIAYLSIALLLPGKGARHRWFIIAALIAVALIGVSRVALGVHWPTDVVAGWTFGAAWSVICCSAALRMDLWASRKIRAE